ncbi:MAG: ribonuclease HII [Acidobacteriia bacterium]|nr:ribonuclease HII [Terriglobia bacterium]
MKDPIISDPPQRKHLRFLCNDAQERRLLKNGYLRIAGIDEVGRGALCGPVVAAAVILNLEAVPKGIDDSKKLTPQKREELFEAIQGSAWAVGFGLVTSNGIDQADILKATIQAMTQAVRQLDPVPDYLLIDALKLPQLPLPQRGLVHGDAQSVSIAAASILAKVTRDGMMREFDRIYPQYGLGHNMGYGTPEHLESLRRFGPSPIHRRTFKPVSQLRLSF